MSAMPGLTRRTLGALALGALATACSRGPQPIAYGVAECEYCRMRIGDPRFGAELITAEGKVLQFDSIECVAGYYATLPGPEAVRGVWVSDYRQPGTLIPVTDARFGRLERGTSPMGLGLFAVAAKAAAAVGDVTPPAHLDWAAVVDLVRREAPTPGSSPHAPHATGPAASR